MAFLEAFAEPEIAARARLVLGAAAAAGILVLIARITLARRPFARDVVLPAARGGFVYLVVGLGTRFLVQHHRSRLQIAVLLGAVACAEILRSRREGGGMPRLVSWLVGSVAVCLGVAAAKWALEPGALSIGLKRLRSLSGNA